MTIEDGTVVGGFGSAVLEFMNANRYRADVTILGIPDRLVEHGTPVNCTASATMMPWP